MTTSGATFAVAAVVAAVAGSLLSACALSSAASLPVAPPSEGRTYTVDTKTLDAATACTHVGERHAVLLVHGTVTNARQAWPYYEAALTAKGYAVCTVDLPHIATSDIQVSAEYVARAIETISVASHASITVITHSQGGLEARWAMKYFSQTYRHVDVLVELGAPNHGTNWVYFICKPSVTCQPAMMQMLPTSAFVRALNLGSNGPGAARYVSIFSRQDTVIEPIDPPTAALDGATNIAMEDVCPTRIMHHGTLLDDAAVFDVVLAEIKSGVPLPAPRITSCQAPYLEAPPDVLTPKDRATSALAGPEPAVAAYAERAPNG